MDDNELDQGNKRSEVKPNKTWGDRLKSSLLISLILVGVWLVVALAAGGKSGYLIAIGIDRNGIEQHFVMLFDPENRTVAALNANTGELFDPSAGDIFLVRPDGMQSITITSDGKNHRFDIDRRSLGQHVWNDMILDPLGFDGQLGLVTDCFAVWA